MSYTNLDDHLAHEIESVAFLTDNRYKSTHPYSEGVKRSYVFRDVKSIKNVINALQYNYQFEMDIDMDNKVIYFHEDQTNLSKDTINRRKEEHSHYIITDYTDFTLILTYYNHDAVTKHLTKNTNSNLSFIILFVLLLLAGVYITL